MATQTNNLLLVSSGVPTKMQAADQIVLASAKVTSALDLTDCTVTGLNVPGGDAITDGTGSLSYAGVSNPGALSTTGTTSIALSGSGAVSLASSGSTVAITSSAGVRTDQIKTSTANSYVLTNGTTSYLTLNTIAGVALWDANLMLAAGTNSSPRALGMSVTAGEDLTAGDIVVVNNSSGSPRMYKANAGTSGKQWPVGTCLLTATTGSTTYVAATGLIPMTMDTAPAATSIGSPVYLSTTSGTASLTSPSSSGQVSTIVGILYGANGTDATVLVFWSRQYLLTY